MRIAGYVIRTPSAGAAWCHKNGQEASSCKFRCLVFGLRCMMMMVT